MYHNLSNRFMRTASGISGNTTRHKPTFPDTYPQAVDKGVDKDVNYLQYVVFCPSAIALVGGVR